MIMMKKFIVIFLSILFLGSASPVCAQESRTEHLSIDIEQAINMALESSEDLEIQDNEVVRKRSE